MSGNGGSSGAQLSAAGSRSDELRSDELRYEVDIWQGVRVLLAFITFTNALHENEDTIHIFALEMDQRHRNTAPPFPPFTANAQGMLAAGMLSVQDRLVILLPTVLNARGWHEFTAVPGLLSSEYIFAWDPATAPPLAVYRAAMRTFQRYDAQCCDRWARFVDETMSDNFPVDPETWTAEQRQHNEALVQACRADIARRMETLTMGELFLWASYQEQSHENRPYQYHINMFLVHSTEPDLPSLIHVYRMTLEPMTQMPAE